MDLQNADKNNSNLLNKIENDNKKTTTNIDNLNNKYNLKIKEIEEQTKKYENEFSEINNEINRLSKDITLKKLDRININDKKTNEVLDNIKTTIISFSDNLKKEVDNIKINNSNDYIKLTKQLEELKNECDNNLINHINEYSEINKKLQM